MTQLVKASHRTYMHSSIRRQDFDFQVICKMSDNLSHPRSWLRLLLPLIVTPLWLSFCTFFPSSVIQVREQLVSWAVTFGVSTSLHCQAGSLPLWCRGGLFSPAFTYDPSFLFVDAVVYLVPKRLHFLNGIINNKSHSLWSVGTRGDETCSRRGEIQRGFLYPWCSEATRRWEQGERVKVRGYGFSTFLP